MSCHSTHPEGGAAAGAGDRCQEPGSASSSEREPCHSSGTVWACRAWLGASAQGSFRNPLLPAAGLQNYHRLPCPSPSYLLSPHAASLPQWAPASAQASPQCRAPVPAATLLRMLHTQQGQLFKASFISETIGGWGGGKTEVVEGFPPCQNSTCEPEERLRGRGQGKGRGGQWAPRLCHSPPHGCSAFMQTHPLPVQLVTSRARGRHEAAV